uniref:Putative 16.8 kDa salivary secreted protein n=1 Tax=Aedes aegypti TaxID=7159 RepID=Q1HQG7_AEDAE|nr:putative 16.8 kDa salivary secreted protein [Aedes aegypti]
MVRMQSGFLQNGFGRKVTIFLLMAIIGVAMACNGGYRIKVRRVHNCAGQDAVIVAQENYTAVLTKNCEIKSRGCVTYKAFKSGVVNYKVKKNGVQLVQGRMDLCDQIASGNRDPTIGPMMRTLNLPNKCPVEAGTLCTDPTQVVNIEQYKQFLPLARGSLEIESEIQHDTGKSCFRLQIDVTK